MVTVFQLSHVGRNQGQTRRFEHGFASTQIAQHRETNDSQHILYHLERTRLEVDGEVLAAAADT
jgi:hypothetical protein